MKRTLLCIAKYTVLILLALIFLLPILYVFYNSLLPYRYVQTWAPISVWTLDNFNIIYSRIFRPLQVGDELQIKKNACSAMRFMV